MDNLNQITNYYENLLSDPRLVVGDMDYDEFVDWLELGTVEDIEEAILVFAKHNMFHHVEIMKITANKLRKLENERICSNSKKKRQRYF